MASEHLDDARKAAIAEAWKAAEDAFAQGKIGKLPSFARVATQDRDWDVHRIAAAVAFARRHA